MREAEFGDLTIAPFLLLYFFFSNSYDSWYLVSFLLYVDFMLHVLHLAGSYHFVLHTYSRLLHRSMGPFVDTAGRADPAQYKFR